MNAQGLNIAWTGLRVALREQFSFNEIKEIAGLAGIDLTLLSHLVQRARGGAAKGELMDALDERIGALSGEEKQRVLVRVAEVMVLRRPAVADSLPAYLEPLGWNYANGRLFPIEVLDPRELGELPEAAREDLVKAATRFWDGDLSGALAAACAAVDSATTTIYEQYRIGDPAKDSFQKRCSKALRAKRAVDDMVDALRAVGWCDDDAKRVAKNMQGSLNQGASVMQMLRSKMGDVHGTKPALRTVVFDSLKWASLIVAALK